MDLQAYRRELDSLDKGLLELFCRRMEIAAQIGAYKKEKGLPVLDAAREKEKLLDIAQRSPAGMAEYAVSFFSHIMALSRECQEHILARDAQPVNPGPPRHGGGRKCGLLGRKLGHSYSPAIHAMLADYDYALFEREPEAVGDFLRNGEWDGLNVTIPYKKTVLPYCAELSETARAIGSVNTLLRRPDGSIYGDNTDACGFETLVKLSGIPVAGKKTLVLGSGGASASVCHVLRRLGAGNVTVISRSGADNYDNLDRHADAEIIVNTTPLGTYPNNGAAAVDLRDFPQCAGVLDVVYNPARTALILQAEKLGIPHASGLTMLVAQARRSAELFTASAIDDGEVRRIVAALGKGMQNIILIGMPGSGKSSLSALLAEQLHRPLYEADEAIAQKAGCTIPEIFAREGEDGFRRRETEVLRELGKLSGAVISTGGGCVTREENYDLLHQNGTMIWIRRDLSALPREGRPISQRSDLGALYAARAPLYARFADAAVDNDGSLAQTLQKLLEVLA